MLLSRFARGRSIASRWRLQHPALTAAFTPNATVISRRTSQQDWQGLVCACAATAATVTLCADESITKNDESHRPTTSELAKIHGKPKIVFVLGGPGAGKGTQCSLLVERYGFTHLSAGDLLRAERASGSKDGDLILSYINEGKIVPVEITVRLLKKAIEEAGNTKFLIDGFPRNFDNVEGWERVMGDSVDVRLVLMYDTDEDTMLKRLLQRAETSGRTDDNEEVIRKRFRVYLNSTLPVIDYFRKQGKVSVIDSSGSVEQVFNDTRNSIAPLVREEATTSTVRLARAIRDQSSELLSYGLKPEAVAKIESPLPNTTFEFEPVDCSITEDGSVLVSLLCEGRNADGPAVNGVFIAKWKWHQGERKLVQHSYHMFGGNQIAFRQSV